MCGRQENQQAARTKCQLLKTSRKINDEVPGYSGATRRWQHAQENKSTKDWNEKLDMKKEKEQFTKSQR